MAMSCNDAPMPCMMLPILAATSPDTPVSISSKIKVGM